MKKIKVLINIGFLYHKAALDPVIELLLNNEKYDVWFSLKHEKKRWLFIDLPYNVPVVKTWEKLGYRFTSETNGFDIVLTGDTMRNAKDYDNALLCFVAHGTGLKTVLYRNLAKFPDCQYHIFVESQFRAQSMLNASPVSNNKVHVVGLPKMDFYFQGKYDKKVIIQKYGLNPDKPTVLFAPTYKPTCLYDIKDDLFEQTKDCNLIIKLHPYSWMGKYAPHKQHRIFQRRVKKYPHAALLPFDEYNIVPFYTVADTIISEASASIFDFLATGKTGIVFDLPCDKLTHSDGQPLLEIDNREFLKDAYVHIDSGRDIKSAVERALNPTYEMKDNIKLYREKYFYKPDGKASERLITKIEELLIDRRQDTVS